MRALHLGPHELLILAGIGAFVLAIALVSALAENPSNLWLQRAGERIGHDVRVGLYDRLQRLSLRFHEQRQKGDLVTRVTGDVNAVGDMFATSLGTVVQSAVLLLGMLIVTSSSTRSSRSSGSPWSRSSPSSLHVPRASPDRGARQQGAGRRASPRRERGALGDGGREGLRLRDLRARPCAGPK